MSTRAFDSAAVERDSGRILGRVHAVEGGPGPISAFAVDKTCAKGKMPSSVRCLESLRMTIPSPRGATLLHRVAAASSRLRAVACVLAAVVVVLPALPSRAADLDPREINARKRFASGQYQEALDGFAQLFAETGDPIFLRNV